MRLARYSHCRIEGIGFERIQAVDFEHFTQDLIGQCAIDTRRVRPGLKKIVDGPRFARAVAQYVVDARHSGYAAKVRLESDGNLECRFGEIGLIRELLRKLPKAVFVVDKKFDDQVIDKSAHLFPLDLCVSPVSNIRRLALRFNADPVPIVTP